MRCNFARGFFWLLLMHERFCHADAMRKCVFVLVRVCVQAVFKRANSQLLFNVAFCRAAAVQVFFSLCVFCFVHISSFCGMRREVKLKRREGEQTSRGRSVGRVEEEKRRGFGGLVGVQIVASLLPPAAVAN